MNSTDAQASPQAALAPAEAMFGGPVDLLLLWLGAGGSDARPVSCLDCRTLNSPSAPCCKGCGGRLPAFHAMAAHASAVTQPRASPQLSRLLDSLGVAPRWLAAGAYHPDSHRPTEQHHARRLAE